jgi:cytoskeleton protein RodZ
MGGFGERMQREREMRSISLEEIAESTKIGCRMLRALEEEDFDKLPGGIFNKGFVRAYAKFLGIDEEQAVVDFQTAFLEKQQRHAANGSNGLQHSEVLAGVQASSTYAEEGPQPDQAAGFMRAAIIIVVLVGIGVLGWKFWPVKTAAVNPTETAAPRVVTQNIPAAPAPATTDEPSTAKKDTSTITEPIAKAAAPEPSAETARGAATDSGILRLQIHARERSWIKITGDDGKLLMQGEIAPGGSRSFRATRQMVLTLGNAAGVEISYNGQTLPQFPADPKTRTLTFTPEGLLQ